MPILPCAICDRQFNAGSTRAKYCSQGCRSAGTARAKAAYMRQWHAEYRSANGKSQSADFRRRARGLDPELVINCSFCKEPLENVRSDMARYPMHKKCRALAPDWMGKGRDNPRRSSFQAKIDKAASGTTSKRVFTCGGCRWCGEYFVGVGVYCSKKCSASAQFTRRGSGKSFKISPRARLEIYERDAWVCQLCFNQVDPSLRHRDLWSATLDHIIPQALTIVPDHSPSNLRLAHMWCNSARGDGSNMTEAEFLERVAAHFGSELAA